ncbi:hypothetical protein [Pyxidicoccus xibeiensis]|uniref:hypothetical protein n=1 Tax=Pyxidicoccus xibeiensis TaxID=2906759 RepID=UPI0020A7BE94|nr:hypothetical protein [Pyxidicoccus xibeiensis]MCP3138606.1 hypothetical protein [Pyxidicoccus xibeiensis]
MFKCLVWAVLVVAAMSNGCAGELEDPGEQVWEELPEGEPSGPRAQDYYPLPDGPLEPAMANKPCKIKELVNGTWVDKRWPSGSIMHGTLTYSNGLCMLNGGYACKVDSTASGMYCQGSYLRIHWTLVQAPPPIPTNCPWPEINCCPAFERKCRSGSCSRNGVCLDVY